MNRAATTIFHLKMGEPEARVSPLART